MVVNDVVEEHTADPAKVTVDGRESTLDVGPGARLVVVHFRVVVVEVGDGDYLSRSVFLWSPQKQVLGIWYVPSQWWTHMYGTM